MAFCIHGRAKPFVHSFLSYLPKELNETSKKLVQSETSLEMQVKVLCFFFVLNSIRARCVFRTVYALNDLSEFRVEDTSKLSPDSYFPGCPLLYLR